MAQAASSAPAEGTSAGQGVPGRGQRPPGRALRAPTAFSGTRCGEAKKPPQPRPVGTEPTRLRGHTRTCLPAHRNMDSETCHMMHRCLEKGAPWCHSPTGDVLALPQRAFVPQVQPPQSPSMLRAAPGVLPPCGRPGSRVVPCHEASCPGTSFPLPFLALGMQRTGLPSWAQAFPGAMRGRRLLGAGCRKCREGANTSEQPAALIRQRPTT